MLMFPQVGKSIELKICHLILARENKSSSSLCSFVFLIASLTLFIRQSALSLSFNTFSCLEELFIYYKQLSKIVIHSDCFTF